jgi:hypothetical protein
MAFPHSEREPWSGHGLEVEVLVASPDEKTEICQSGFCGEGQGGSEER